MTDDDLPPRYTRLTFHGPLSDARADRLVARLARTRPATVLDLGCGWGELMLRVLAEVPGAIGTGVDPSPADLARGRAGAAARGLAHRVSFLEESAVGTTRGTADLVLCVGSSGWQIIPAIRWQPRSASRPMTACPSGCTDPAAAWAWPT